MSLHTWHRQGPCKPRSCTTFMLNPHWGRTATGKKKSCIYVHKVTSVMSNSLRSYRQWLPGFSVTGVLQARIREHSGQDWLPHPSRSLYLLLP